MSLEKISDVGLLEAWNGAIGEIREPRSALRTRLDPLLCEALATSPACLSASLEALLRGYDSDSVSRVVARASELRAPGGRTRAALAILPSTVPGVGLEPLLACLALRLPIMMKLATREPHFSAAFVEEFTRRLPDAAEAIAIGHWRGGDEAIESRVLDDLDPIVAYGDARTGRRSARGLRAQGEHRHRLGYRRPVTRRSRQSPGHRPGALRTAWLFVDSDDLHRWLEPRRGRSTPHSARASRRALAHPHGLSPARRDPAVPSGERAAGRSDRSASRDKGDRTDRARRSLPTRARRSDDRRTRDLFRRGSP